MRGVQREGGGSDVSDRTGAVDWGWLPGDFERHGEDGSNDHSFSM